MSRRRHGQGRSGYSSRGKSAVPRHRTLSRSSADALERSLERLSRRAGREACAEGEVESEGESEDQGNT